MSAHTEPAIKSYFFGKGYQDLLAVIKDSWQRNNTSAQQFFSRINHHGETHEKAFGYLFWGGAGASVVVFGSLVFGIVSALHVTILGLFFALIYVGFTVVWATERSLLFIRELFVACPHCHKRSNIPEYYCDNCGRIHKQLMPNSYGIFRHRCVCGQYLPSSFLVNRGRLQASCPHCHQLLHRDQVEAQKIHIPILGGPFAGKTAFMFAVVQQIIECQAKKLGFTPEFIETKNQTEYQKITEEMKKGVVPGKTVTSIPTAFNLALKKDGKTKWLLYIYDPSGETFEKTDNMTGHHYQEYMDGLILIIDPFSIPAVRRDYEQQLSKTWNNVNPSQLQVQDALTRMLLTMESSYNLKKTDKVKKPLAVVFSKVDAFDLEDKIGESALARYTGAQPGESLQDTRNNMIKQQLKEWGEAGLVQQLETRFTTINFFTCSALGRIPDGSNDELISNHVMEPVEWLLQSVNVKDFKV